MTAGQQPASHEHRTVTVPDGLAGQRVEHDRLAQLRAAVADVVEHRHVVGVAEAACHHPVAVVHDTDRQAGERPGVEDLLDERPQQGLDAVLDGRRRAAHGTRLLPCGAARRGRLSTTRRR